MIVLNSYYFTFYYRNVGLAFAVQKESHRFSLDDDSAPFLTKEIMIFIEWEITIKLLVLFKEGKIWD